MEWLRDVAKEQMKEALMTVMNKLLQCYHIYVLDEKEEMKKKS